MPTEAITVPAEVERDDSRASHLAWCKQRALEDVLRGDASGAFSSMSSDLDKHPETKGHCGIELGFMLMMNGLLRGYESRRWIEGFN